MIFGKFVIALVVVIVVFWMIGGLLRDRTRR
jgi:septation ring formation regulator EzrA